MKNILIPTDFSRLGNYAYDLANKIANATQAKIHVLSIVQATPDVVFDTDGNVKNCGEQNISVFQEQEKDLIEKMMSWTEGKENIEFKLVKIGHIKEDILRYIEQNNIDLVVMGTEGAYGLEEILMESHAGQLVLEAPIPILTLKCDRSEMEIKDLLLVCDFHHPAKINLSMVKTLQEAFGAKLNLLKVNTPKDFEAQRKVVLNMQEFAELNELNNVSYHVYCDENVEQGIVNFSTDTGIDFVAIGTHQRSGLSRLFKKSISNEIVNHVWQPVLTFPMG